MNQNSVPRYDPREDNIYTEITTASYFLRSGHVKLEEYWFSPSVDGDLALETGMLLGGGVERLCKCILLLEAFERGTSFSSRAMRKRFGHNVSKLVDEVVKRCFHNDYLQYRLAKEDHTFLVDNKDLRGFIDLLTKIVLARGRYHHLDVAAGENRDLFDSPSISWYKWEMGFIERRPSLDFSGAHGNFKRDLVRERTALVQRFVRALSRPVCVGALGETAHRLSLPLTRWARIPDSKLGCIRFGEAPEGTRGYYMGDPLDWYKPGEPQT